MTTGERIRQKRLALQLTLEEVGLYVGVAKSTVRKWETGFIENMRIDKIEKLAAVLETTPAYLMGSQEDYSIYKNIEALPETYSVPLLGDIACGEPLLALENLDGYVECDCRINSDFALRCKGESMINARVFDGDIVFIREQPTVENGEIAAVIIDGEATLKRVYQYENRLELRPENPLFPVLNYEGYDLDSIRIVGKAVAFLSNIR